MLRPALLLLLAAAAPAYPAPLALEVEKVEARGDATVKTVRFAGRGPKDQVTAFLVEPKAPASAPRPAVLYVHWFGDPETTNKTQFLKEAVELARSGVVSLLVDALWSGKGWFSKGRYEDDPDRAAKQVAELRRAMDVLLGVPGVDPKRLAFVGHDFGAMYGILAGAADGRPKTYVLLAGTATFHEWFLLRKHQPKDKAAYLKEMEPLDPVKWIGKLAPASVLLQFAEKDEYVSKEKAQSLIDAVKGPKQATFHATDHGMASTGDDAERLRWLSKELGLPKAAP